ncbi:MAG: hypothetical protein HYX24_07215 [Candidatus Aenigmarchaeota archaeon]|nr:hypothetical protein [Candidatus Aenigmarchaeota archaeon]
MTVTLTEVPISSSTSAGFVKQYYDETSELYAETMHTAINRDFGMIGEFLATNGGILIHSGELEGGAVIQEPKGIYLGGAQKYLYRDYFTGKKPKTGQPIASGYILGDNTINFANEIYLLLEGDHSGHSLKVFSSFNRKLSALGMVAHGNSPQALATELYHLLNHD